MAVLPADGRTMLRVGMTNPVGVDPLAATESLIPSVSPLPQKTLAIHVEFQDVLIIASAPMQPFILEHLESIAQHLNDPRVFSFLHIPVQSGSDR